MEVAREVSKIFIGVAVTFIGMSLHGALDGFLTGIPFLAPFAGILSPVLTGIITGIVAALLVYGVDRQFDWLSSTGTEKLLALENRLDAYAQTSEQMFQSLELQFGIHQRYVLMEQIYQRSIKTLSYAETLQEDTLKSQFLSIQNNAILNDSLRVSLPKIIGNEKGISDFLAEREKNKKGEL